VSARSKARKRALDVLYESELRGSDALTTLGERLAQSDPPIPEYAVELVEGVAARRAAIDAAIVAAASADWPMERMPAVDRNVLRIAAYELLFRDDVPEGVVISEAVELATSLSTDESPRFVNGVLSRVAKDRSATEA
jgi:N utilization substance protein B